MSKKKYLPVILYTTLALSTVPAALLYTDYAISNQAEPEKQESRAHIPRVTTSMVSLGSYKNSIHGYGEVNAREELQLNAMVSGEVTWRNPLLEAGSIFKKDTVLLRIDSTDYAAALANAQLTLAEAKLNYQQVLRSHQQAKADWKRSGIAGKPSPLLLRLPQLDSADKRLKAARASVAQAEKDLKNCQIKAPFTGVVINHSVVKGSYIEQGSTIATLQNSESAEIEISLNAVEWRQLQEHQKDIAKIYSRDIPNTSWDAKIKRISAILEKETRQRKVTLSVENPMALKPPLLIGSFVEVSIEGQNLDNLFALPASTLTADGYIWLVENNRLTRYSAKPIFSKQGQIFIPQGKLPEQIQVVNKPMASFIPGIEVTPQLPSRKEEDNQG